MKGTNWGRIVARLTAILIFTRAIDYTYQVFQRYAIDQEYALPESPNIEATQFFVAAALLAMAILLWVFADKFAPTSPDENQEVAEPDKLIIAFVAAFGAFIFLRYINYTFHSVISQAFEENGVLQKVLSASVIYGAVLTILVFLWSCSLAN